MKSTKSKTDKPIFYDEDKVNRQFPSTMTFDKHTVEIQNYKEFASTTDEPGPFQAEVFINGNHVATAVNRGFGGPTDIHPVNEAGHDTVAELESHLATHKGRYPAGVYFNIPIHYDSLAFIVDKLADNLEFRKTIEKNCKRKLTMWNPIKRTVVTVDIPAVKGFKTLAECVTSNIQYKQAYDVIKGDYESKSYVVFNKI